MVAAKIQSTDMNKSRRVSWFKDSTCARTCACSSAHCGRAWRSVTTKPLPAQRCQGASSRRLSLAHTPCVTTERSWQRSTARRTSSTNRVPTRDGTRPPSSSTRPVCIHRSSCGSSSPLRAARGQARAPGAHRYLPAQPDAHPSHACRAWCERWPLAGLWGALHAHTVSLRSGGRPAARRWPWPCMLACSPCTTARLLPRLS